MPRRKSEAVLQKIVNEAQWMITAEEDMPVKRKLEREDRNNSSGGEEMPDVNVEYVVMDEKPQSDRSCRSNSFGKVLWITRRQSQLESEPCETERCSPSRRHGSQDCWQQWKYINWPDVRCALRLFVRQ